MGWMTPHRPMTAAEMIAASQAATDDGYIAMAPPVISRGANENNPDQIIAPMHQAPLPVLAAGAPPGVLPVETDPAKLAMQQAVQAQLAAGSGGAPVPIDNSIRTDEEARDGAVRLGLVGAEQGRDAARARAAEAQDRATDAGIEIAGVEQNVERQKADLLNANNAQQSADMQDFRGDMSVLNAHANQMQRKYNYLADEAARAEMKDFWADKSTGARILGVIAQTLSGAANGLAGQPGAPSPLDRIIDRDFELQKRNLSHKTENAQAALGALGQIYNSISSKQQAFNTMQIAMNNKVKSEIAEMDTLMKSDTSTNRARQAQAQLDQKNAELEAQNRQLDVQQKTNELNQVESNRVTMRGQDVQANMFGNKGSGMAVPGLVGDYDKVTARQFIAKNADLGAGVSQVNGLESLFNKGGEVLDAYRKSEVGNVFLKGLNRGILGTGANLSPEESKDLQGTILNFLKGRTIETLGIQERHQLFSNIRLAYGRIFRGRALATFGGAELDRKHQLWGQTFRELDAEDAAGQPESPAQ